MWFVFAGMGTQWHGMGRDLMEVQVFRESIMKSDVLLKQYKINLYDLLMEGDESVFNDTLNSFVGIAAIQVGLVLVKHVFQALTNISHGKNTVQEDKTNNWLNESKQMFFKALTNRSCGKVKFRMIKNH